MITKFRKSFSKDLKRHQRDKELLERIQETILEIEAANSVTTIKNLKKLKSKALITV